jgi:hypothetical protein
MCSQKRDATFSLNNHRTYPGVYMLLSLLLLLLHTPGVNMKLLAVLLLCSAALAAASQVQQADPAAAGGSCYQLPTCDTPPGDTPFSNLHSKRAAHDAACLRCRQSVLLQHSLPLPFVSNSQPH